MLDRASTFADKEIIDLLQTRFIPVAIDQAYQRRQKDAEGEFYRKIAGKGPRSNFSGTTQGLYVASASGKFLGYSNNRGPERIKRMMKRALDEFKPAVVGAIDAGQPDRRYNPAPPEGGLVVRVRAKVLGGYEKTTNRWRQIFQRSISRDNLWITRDEHEALVESRLLESLQKRIARFHLVDNTRGEPPMWKESEIRRLDLRLKNGRIEGTVHLETRSGDRGFEAAIFGIVEQRGGRVTKLDLAARGEFWGAGRYTRRAPEGKFPLAIVFTLADGQDIADRIPPQGSRGWVPGYLR